jgi:hypothetical protein
MCAFERLNMRYLGVAVATALLLIATSCGGGAQRTNGADTKQPTAAGQPTVAAQPTPNTPLTDLARLPNFLGDRACIRIDSDNLQYLIVGQQQGWLHVRHFATPGGSTVTDSWLNPNQVRFVRPQAAEVCTRLEP